MENIQQHLQFKIGYIQMGLLHLKMLNQLNKSREREFVINKLINAIDEKKEKPVEQK